MDIERKDLPVLFKRVRENKGLTQREVADILGVSILQISKYENGHSLPGGERLLWYLSNDSPPIIVNQECPTCNGSGYITGLRRNLFKVRETLELNFGNEEEE
jgi:transcriptional regulator with XRE-family HTH domain